MAVERLPIHRVVEEFVVDDEEAPHAQEALLWLHRTARSSRNDTLNIPAELGPSENPLSGRTIAAFRSDFFYRIDAVLDRTRQYQNADGGFYFTDGEFLIQIKRANEKNEETGEEQSIRRLSMTLLYEDETPTQAVDRVKKEKDYDWEIQAWIIDDRTKDVSHILYIDTEHEFSLSPNFGEDEKPMKYPLIDTPRGVAQTEQAISLVELIYKNAEIER